MPLFYFLVYTSLGIAILALALEFLFTKKISKWFFVYLLASFFGGLTFSFLTFGDIKLLMQNNFLNTQSFALAGSGIFVYLALLLKNRLARSLAERFSRKQLLLFLFLIFLVLIVNMSMKMGQSPDFIKSEINRANYCDSTEDCAQISTNCPFDCYVYVNKDEKNRIEDLINTFESKCTYGCVEAPSFTCENRKCVPEDDGFKNRDVSVIDSFEKCIEAGFPAMESYPRQCRSDNETFTENIGNELDKIDLIRLNSPRPNEVIASPLKISGEARGYWFFEGDFPVVLTDWDGIIIAEGIATAKSDWMTEDFVEFEVELTFETPSLYNRGSLILQKDNPSGLPENDDALEIPIKF